MCADLRMKTQSASYAIDSLPWNMTNDTSVALANVTSSRLNLPNPAALSPITNSTLHLLLTASRAETFTTQSFIPAAPTDPPLLQTATDTASKSATTMPSLPLSANSTNLSTVIPPVPTNSWTVLSSDAQVAIIIVVVLLFIGIAVLLLWLRGRPARRRELAAAATPAEGVVGRPPNMFLGARAAWEDGGGVIELLNPFKRLERWRIGDVREIIRMEESEIVDQSERDSLYAAFIRRMKCLFVRRPESKQRSKKLAKGHTRSLTRVLGEQDSTRQLYSMQGWRNSKFLDTTDCLDTTTSSSTRQDDPDEGKSSFGTHSRSQASEGRWSEQSRTTLSLRGTPLELV